jgi:regulator of protease activity HflC (stomatin/prohibitin superfamily)
MEVLGIAVVILVFLLLATIRGSFATEVASIARFGKFHGVAGAGLKWKAPFIGRAGYFTRKSIGEIDQTNRLFLSHSRATGSCSRC